jgi:hypothetical protein
MKIYVVMGEIGEYSDRKVWIAKAFTQEEQAQKYIIEATEWLKQFSPIFKDPFEYHEFPKEAANYDKKITDDFSGYFQYYEVNYFYEEAELSEFCDHIFHAICKIHRDHYCICPATTSCYKCGFEPS